eukprot:6351854-Alexandrium_andersonii.AAC.1
MIPARAGGKASPTARQSVARSPESFMVSGTPCSLASALGLQYLKPVGPSPGAGTTCTYHGLGRRPTGGP